jgi:hypothetical protein
LFARTIADFDGSQTQCANGCWSMFTRLPFNPLGP